MPNRFSDVWIRSAATKLLEPFMRAAVRVYTRASDYERSKIGRFTIYGPADFLNECSSAIKLLDEPDEQPCAGSASASGLEIWLSDERQFRFPLYRMYSISKDILAHGVQGIATFLFYYSRFNHHLFQGTRGALRKHALKAIDRTARSETATWLMRRNFAPELLEAFQDAPPE